MSDDCDGVTKLGKVKYKSTRSSLLRITVDTDGMSEDIGLSWLDRCIIMRALKQRLRKDKQRRISRETMEIYAPLAHRLGISSVMGVGGLVFPLSQ